MKIEFSRAEIERIILDYANRFTKHSEMMFYAESRPLFNIVESSSYRGLPDTLTVSVKEEDAAQ